MTTKNITGIIAWLKGWFFDKDEITSKEQALQTQINNKASQSDLNTTNSNVSSLQTQMSSKANQSDLNTTNSNVATLQSKVNALENVELVKIVASLPTASASTMNTLYVVTNGGSTTNNLYSIYVTVKDGSTYSWEKLDDADLQGFITTETANATFAPKSHATTGSTYGLSTTTKYGHSKVVQDLTTDDGNGLALGAGQGKVLKGLVDACITTASANDAFAPKSHAVNTSTYGLGTTSVYGHVKTINSLTQSSHQNGTALSAYQGKILKGIIDGCIKDIELVPKTTDSSGAIKLIFSNE